MSVGPSTKSSFDFNEIWHVGRGQWVMHDGMQYDPIQGQGHKPLKVGNPSIFNSYLFRHIQWELATDHWFLNLGTISKFDLVRFLKFILVLCHMTLNLAETSVVKSRLCWFYVIRYFLVKDARMFLSYLNYHASAYKTGRQVSHRKTKLILSCVVIVVSPCCRH